MTKKRVMGFGTFDTVHPGHLFYLEQLKALGDELYIVIARDKNVAKIKGSPTHIKENDRKSAVEALGIADKVVLGDATDFFKVLRDHKPDVLGFGYDQRVNLEDIQTAFPEMEIVRLKAHKPELYKSSLIKAKFLG